MTKLMAEHEDASRKFMNSTDIGADVAEEYLRRMVLIGKNMELLQKMMDLTIGRVAAPRV